MDITSIFRGKRKQRANVFFAFQEPIRSETFSLTRLEAHAESLARAQTVTSDPKRGKEIAARMKDNRRVLESACVELLAAVAEHRAVTPAAEWLMDNFHIVRAQLKDIHDHLPPQFYSELPKLADGPLKGLPRVYGIAWAFVAHTDSRFDPELLKSFLIAYQKIQPLTIGELWAVSITLRAVLIENLRRLADLIVGAQVARKEADRLADEILGLSETKERPIEVILTELEDIHFTRPFAVQLLQRLRFQDTVADPVLEWLYARLSRDGISVDEAVATEHSGQSGANATVRNIITSARLMSVFDWRIFFEEVSLVEAELRTDENYGKMDFISRNRYRHGLEELARYSPLKEIDVAKLVIEKARAAKKYLEGGITSLDCLTRIRKTRATDPGYYLISSGRRKFENEIGFAPRWSKKFLRRMGDYSSFLFISAILFITIMLVAVTALIGAGGLLNANNALTILCLSLTALFPASEISVALTQRIVVAMLGPKYLPRLDLENGIPDDLKTFVVVPTFLTKIEKIAEQLEQLETHYLANPDKNLRFALLTDWVDADSESTEHDNDLLHCAREKLVALNDKFGQASSGEDLFYIYHRKRLFNKQQGKWMGWERKRGKLHEFNRLLLGLRDTTYIPLGTEAIKVPSHIRYVITLDADTKLPRGTAAQLIGTLAHPLNRAHIDHEKNRVTHGYGILQPRITPALPSTKHNTAFQRISAGPSGVDPYAAAISDVYQDLFDEGSYTGKGIYDVAVFEAVLAQRAPENALLSHDLFEGNFARCGFVSDIEFFEDFPSHSGVSALRAHRWIRGDWQLLPWILGARGSGMSTISRWKMLDNLRRSLTPLMTLLLIILELTVRHTGISVWFILGLSSLFVPAILIFIADIFPQRRTYPFWQHFQLTIRDVILSVELSVLNLMLLPYRAWISADAIIRTLYRLFISHKKLLEWTTAAQSEAMMRLTLRSFLMGMRGALFLTVVSAVVVVVFNPANLLVAALLMLLWFVSPLVARQLSTPPKPRDVLPVELHDMDLLISSARRVWRFFTTFVTQEENFLPPDNFQESPNPVVAHRSSPTNFGLYLLSILAARDFGWIGTLEMANRLGLTLKSLGNLPKHQGHFYNWYETTDCRPLEPKYISSVDNGNLAGHLISVAQGAIEKLFEPVRLIKPHRGLLATFLLIEEESNKLASTNDFFVVLEDIKQTLLMPDELVVQRLDYWVDLHGQIDRLLELAKETLDVATQTVNHELLTWIRALKSDIDSSYEDFSQLISWREFAHEAGSDKWAAAQLKVWNVIQSRLLEEPCLKDIPVQCEKIVADVIEFKRSFKKDDEATSPEFLDLLLEALENAKISSHKLILQLTEIYDQCHHLCREMDFKLLYDPVRKLFSIGLRVSDNTLDSGYYDLLASEARLTSFIAIAKGDVPVAHWFSLGRTMIPVGHGAALVSWSGSMFEYLMPSLVMHTPTGSLLEQTLNLVIRRQIDYAEHKNIPWGISESAYNKRDLHHTYQYSNFGIPDLGLKRGLAADLVVAPYASFLAAMFTPALASANLKNLAGLGASGPYGFYEAVDFTASRLPQGQAFAVVKTYMAHHQGMSLVSLANIFNAGAMQRRFHAEPLIKATELLLQERTPRNIGTIKPNKESFQIGIVREISEDVSRIYHTTNRPIPTTLLISHGDYTVMLTTAGSGFSRFRHLALTRWREDVTRDHWGSYFYLKDLKTGKVWSATYQPTCVQPDSHEVRFMEDRAVFTREDHGILCRLEIFISSEDSAEVRRLTLTNTGSTARDIEITSYAEIVINTQAADVAHPAFSNLFVQTEFVPELNALMAHRRQRSVCDDPVWMAQVLVRDSHAVGDIEYETDREHFLGRGRSGRNPKAVLENTRLKNSTGAVLDPIFSMRTKVRLEPEVKVNITYYTFVAATRDELVHCAEKFNDASTFDRVANLAWTQAQIKLNYLNIEPVEAHQFQRLATRLLFSDSSLRPAKEVLKRNTKDVTGLWAHGISGDYPIVLLKINDIEDRGIVRQLLKAHEYLATKRLEVDLVILNDKANSYTQELQNTIESMVHSSMVLGHSPLPQSRGKVFILRTDLLQQADVDLLYAEARATLSSRLGSLAEQVKRTRYVAEDLMPRRKVLPVYPDETTLLVPYLQFFNGFGGFSSDGHEYVIALKNNETTPAPWINVIANSKFGFQVSESGSGYTWSMNSRENQLTPWSNDPVSDPSGETFYILDRETNVAWSPTTHPIRVPGSVYLIHHGQGYTRFKNLVHGIYSELTQFVAGDEPAKISQLVLENKSGKVRRLSISAYVEWVLGFSRAAMAPTTITEFDEDTGALFAFNRRNSEYGEHVACFTLLKDSFSFTGDRAEFIGRNGSLNAPKGVFHEGGLSGRVGAGFDPCTAVQREIRLAPGEKIELCFLLGQEKNREKTRELVHRMSARDMNHVLAEVIHTWNRTLGKVQVETPDRALNMVLNRWWLYQTMVCRLFARAAFYQVGGAFGFRDQLQDVMALLLTSPDLAREQILHAASRQYVEGDVQHWWHPPTGRGVRTHFSDDLIWLPYVVFHYIKVTGDRLILEQEIPFLEGPPLAVDQETSYYTPTVSHQVASLYEHCVRALDHSLKTGSHGLPLMGSGDWNDGMNRVGHEGKGESVWLGWFLHTNLSQFSEVAEAIGDSERARTWLNHAASLKHALENEAWDGAWYRRAYYDDGTPLGSAENQECQIDSLAQTWSVISGAAEPTRSAKAMKSLDQYLVRSEDKIVLLFTPPFDKTTKDPGYIKGYLPGVRENGGQYTHAAAWSVIAFAMMGQGKRAVELLTLLNPVNHALTKEAASRYKVEPYVLAGDVYSVAPHSGRGGWSWYTGSAAWMYRAAIEFVLGFKIHGNELIIDPCGDIPWDSYKIQYQYGGGAVYTVHIKIENRPVHKTKLTLDGKAHTDSQRVKLIDDGLKHVIEVVLYG